MSIKTYIMYIIIYMHEVGINERKINIKEGCKRLLDTYETENNNNSTQSYFNFNTQEKLVIHK